MTTNTAGSNTTATGYAQKGITYVSQSPVEFKLNVSQLKVDGVTGASGESGVELHLKPTSPNGDSLDAALLPPDATVPPGFQVSSNSNTFYLLRARVTNDGSTLMVTNTLGQGVTADRIITSGDFRQQLEDNGKLTWKYVGRKTITVLIDPGQTGTNGLNAILRVDSPAEPGVAPNNPPTVTCPSPVTAEATSSAGATVPLTVQVNDADGDALMVTWTVDNAVVQTDVVPGGAPLPTSANVSLTRTYSLGTHTVSVSVDDGRGGSASCQTTVTVQDTTPPSIVCTVSVSRLRPADHTMVNVGLNASASDADPNLTIGVVVFGDEEDEEPTGDGTFSPDAKDVDSVTKQVINPANLRLRAERRNDADGRVYLIVVIAIDPSGNVGFDCCTVVVSKDNTKASMNSVQAQAAAARALCPDFVSYVLGIGSLPSGYVAIGDGPIIGNKQ
jgi:hypothetical protein